MIVYKYKCKSGSCARVQMTSTSPGHLVTCKRCGHSMKHTHTVYPAGQEPSSYLTTLIPEKVAKPVPVHTIHYDGLKYGNDMIGGDTLAQLLTERDLIRKQLRNYRKFAKLYDWKQEDGK